MISKTIILLILSVFFCFFSSLFAKKINLVDIPDGLRKKHEGNIPLSGGIAIFLSLLTSALIFDSYISWLNKTIKMYYSGKRKLYASFIYGFIRNS